MSGLVEPSAPPRATRGPVTGHETDGSDTHKLDCYRCGLGDFRTRDLAHDFLGSWFEPSTAHLNPRSYAVTRMVPWVRCATDAVQAQGVHTSVHTRRETSRPALTWRGVGRGSGSLVDGASEAG
jgi:hypothetical protein